MFGDQNEWQDVQCIVTLSTVQSKLRTFFSEISTIRPKNEDNGGGGNFASKLEKIFMEMLETAKNNTNNYQYPDMEIEMCQTLLLRKHIVGWMRTQLKGGEEDKKIEEIIAKYYWADKGDNFKLTEEEKGDWIIIILYAVTNEKAGTLFLIIFSLVQIL